MISVLMDRHSPDGKWSRTFILLGRMSGRRIVLVAHGLPGWNIYSSRTYARIRRMVLVSLFGVSDLFNIMSDYSDGVWFREMMQLMLSDDTDSDDGARDLIMR
jgi:hypothetical protein